MLTGLELYYSRVCLSVVLRNWLKSLQPGSLEDSGSPLGATLEGPHLVQLLRQSCVDNPRMVGKAVRTLQGKPHPVGAGSGMDSFKLFCLNTCVRPFEVDNSCVASG